MEVYDTTSKKPTCIPFVVEITTCDSGRLKKEADMTTNLVAGVGLRILHIIMASR